jgi:hypothetical protein
MARRKSLICDVCGVNIRASKVYSAAPPNLEATSTFVLLRLGLAVMVKRFLPACKRLLFVGCVWGICVPLLLFLLYTLVVVGRSETEIVKPPLTGVASSFFGPSLGPVVAAWVLGVVLLLVSLTLPLVAVAWDEWCTENAAVFGDALRPDVIPEEVVADAADDDEGEEEEEEEEEGEENSGVAPAEIAEQSTPPESPPGSRAGADRDEAGVLSHQQNPQDMQGESTAPTMIPSETHFHASSKAHQLADLHHAGASSSGGVRASVTAADPPAVDPPAATTSKAVTSLQLIGIGDAPAALGAIAHRWDDERDFTLLDLFGVTGPLDAAMESTLVFFVVVTLASFTCLVVPMIVFRWSVSAASLPFNFVVELMQSSLLQDVAAYAVLCLSSFGGWYAEDVMTAFRIIDPADAAAAVASVSPTGPSRVASLCMWLIGTLTACGVATLLCRLCHPRLSIRRIVVTSTALMRFIVIQTIQYGLAPLFCGLLLCLTCAEYLATPGFESMTVAEAWSITGPVFIGGTSSQPLNPITVIRALYVIAADVEAYRDNAAPVCWNFFAYSAGPTAPPAVANAFWRMFGEGASFRKYAAGTVLQRVWLGSDRYTFLSCLCAGIVLSTFVWYNVLQLRLRLHHNVLRYMFPTPINPADPNQSLLAAAVRLSTGKIVLVAMRNIFILAATALLVIEPGARFARYITGGGGWPMIVAMSSGSALVDGITINLLFFGGRLVHLVALFHHVEGVDAWAPFRRLAMVDDAVVAGYDRLIERFARDLDLYEYLVRTGVAPASSADFLFPVRLSLLALIYWMLLVCVMCLSLLPGLVVHAALFLFSPFSEGDASYVMSIHCLVIGWCLVLVTLQLHSIVVAPLRRRARSLCQFFLQLRHEGPPGAADVAWLRAHAGLEELALMRIAHTPTVIDGGRITYLLRLCPFPFADSLLEPQHLAELYSAASASASPTVPPEIRLHLLRVGQYWGGPRDTSPTDLLSGFVLTALGVIEMRRELSAALEAMRCSGAAAKKALVLLAGSIIVVALPLWLGGGVVLLASSALGDYECLAASPLAILAVTWLIGAGLCSAIVCFPKLGDVIIRRSAVRGWVRLWWSARGLCIHLSPRLVFLKVIRPTFSDVAPLTFVPAALQFVVEPVLTGNMTRSCGLFVIFAVMLKRVYFAGWNEDPPAAQQNNANAEAAGELRRRLEPDGELEPAAAAAADPRVEEEHDGRPIEPHLREATHELQPPAPPVPVHPLTRVTAAVKAGNLWLLGQLRVALGRVIDQEYLEGIALHNYQPPSPQ